MRKLPIATPRAVLYDMPIFEMYSVISYNSLECLHRRVSSYIEKAVYRVYSYCIVVMTCACSVHGSDQYDYIIHTVDATRHIEFRHITSGGT